MIVIMVSHFSVSLRSPGMEGRRGSEKEHFMINKQHFRDTLLFGILKVCLCLNTTFVD